MVILVPVLLKSKSGLELDFVYVCWLCEKRVSVIRIFGIRVLLYLIQASTGMEVLDLWSYK